MKKLFIILLLSLTLTANAVELQTIQIKPTLWEKVSVCKWHISCYFSKNLGTTLTTITGTETVSYALKTTVNNNFTALNNGKIEVSTTTLPLITTLAGLTSVGTIATGTWNGTTLTVSKGGTGSTTLSAYQVLLGNGTSGITVPSGWGTSGQFLTSNGAGAYPSWQTSSVNQTDSYNFTGTYFGIKNLYASSTIYWGGIDYVAPVTEGASSTVMKTNGSGTLIWDSEDWQLLGESTLTSANATATVSGLPARRDLRVILESPGIATLMNPALMFNQDYANNYAYYAYENFVKTGSGGTGGIVTIYVATTTSHYIVFDIQNTATQIKRVSWKGVANIGITLTGSGSWKNTSDQITSITFWCLDGGQQYLAGTRISVYGSKN